MAETDELILFIGKGPSLEKTSEYREATYFLADRPDHTHRTPFVAEALVRLTERSFNRIHVMGTSDAMWNVLLERSGHELDEETFDQLLALREESPDAFPELLRKRIQERVGDHLDTAVEPHLIPVGASTEEYWEILRRLSRLNLEDGRVSVDLTHSLRSHPIFLLLALAYFRVIREDLSLGSVYYGAYVLAEDHFGGQAPIFDLRPMVELLDWIDAAQAFDRYGDATPLATLLRESGVDLDELARRAEYFSQVLQLNTLSDVKSDAESFQSQLAKLSEDSPLPLRLIRPHLERFPSKLQNCPTWKSTLVVARQHWESYRTGPAVLSTWEAIIERLAEVYGKDPENLENHKALSSMARATTVWSVGPRFLRDFHRKARELNEYRNAAAHGRQGDIQPATVYDNFPDLLNYFEDTLPEDRLENLPDYVSLSSFKTNG